MPCEGLSPEEGPAREIRSDQGTNLVGAEKELNLALQQMDYDEFGFATDGL